MASGFWKRNNDAAVEVKHHQTRDLVPLDLHQFPNPISASIGALTISKLGLLIEEHQPRDTVTGRDFAVHLTSRISQLFIDSIPHLVSIPFPSIWPLFKPSQWKITRIPLIRMDVTHYGATDEKRQQLAATDSPHGFRTGIKSYRLQTLWPRITLLELAPPSLHMTNSHEMTVEITGGLLHSKAAPVIASLQLNTVDAESESKQANDEQQNLLPHFLKKFLPGSSTATIISSGNERLVFDTEYLGRVPTALYPQGSERQWSGTRGIDYFLRYSSYSFRTASKTDEDVKNVAVFQVSSRMEFPPTSLDFFVVGSDATERKTQATRALAKRASTSTELRKEVDALANKRKEDGNKKPDDSGFVTTMKRFLSSSPPPSSTGDEIGKEENQNEPMKVPMKVPMKEPMEVPMDSTSLPASLRENRWPSRDANRLVWFLWWQRQSQQIFIGILFRRFHKYIHANLPKAYVAPLQPKSEKM